MSERSELDDAVDAFAAEMKRRLHQKARQGWFGWKFSGRGRLGQRLLSNASKGIVTGDAKSLVDTANLAMMCHMYELTRKPK